MTVFQALYLWGNNFLQMDGSFPVQELFPAQSKTQPLQPLKCPGNVFGVVAHRVNHSFNGTPLLSLRYSWKDPKDKHTGTEVWENTFLPASSPAFQETKLHSDKHTCGMAAATSICSLMKEMQSNRKPEIASIWRWCLWGYCHCYRDLEFKSTSFCGFTALGRKSVW